MVWVAHMPSMGSAAPPQVPRPGLCQSARWGLEPPPASWACCRSHSIANIITCAGWPGPPRAGKNTPADSKNTSPGSQPRQGFSLLREVFPATPPKVGSAAKSCLQACPLEAFLSHGSTHLHRTASLPAAPCPPSRVPTTAPPGKTGQQVALSSRHGDKGRGQGPPSSASWGTRAWGERDREEIPIQGASHSADPQQGRPPSRYQGCITVSKQK